MAFYIFLIQKKQNYISMLKDIVTKRTKPKIRTVISLFRNYTLGTDGGQKSYFVNAFGLSAYFCPCGLPKCCFTCVYIGARYPSSVRWSSIG